MKALILTLFAAISVFSCSHHSSNSTKIFIDKIESQEEKTPIDSITIFGVLCAREPLSIINSLAEANIIAIDRDSFHFENGSLKNGVMIFERVGFGINPVYENKRLRGFNFISSQNIDDTYDRIKQYISLFYGKPYDEEPYHCTWDSDMYIKLRPLRTDEGGTVMLWHFWY